MFVCRVGAMALTLAVLAPGCASFRDPASNKNTFTDAGTVPPFLDDDDPGVNPPLGKLRILNFYENNYEVFLAISRLPDATVIREMRVRVRDRSLPSHLRILAAGTLASYGEREGQSFLKRLARGTGHDAHWAIWMIGNTPHLRHQPDNERTVPVNMLWAEDFMISALQDKRVLQPKGAAANSDPSESSWFRVDRVAIADGEFPERLADMKSWKALPLILRLIRESPAKMDQAVKHLSAFGGPQVEALLLEILTHRTGVLYGYHPAAAVAAAELDLKQAVPLLLLDLDYEGIPSEGIHQALVRLGDASIVPAIETRLPQLARYERDRARLTIIHLRSGDTVPALIDLLREREYKLHMHVIGMLGESKDRRAVPALLEEMVRKDPNANCIFSIRALGKIGGTEAIAGLIEGLGLDFSYLRRAKVPPSYDHNPRIRKEIATALKMATGQDFGADAVQWKAWFMSLK